MSQGHPAPGMAADARFRARFWVESERTAASERPQESQSPGVGPAKNGPLDSRPHVPTACARVPSPTTSYVMEAETAQSLRAVQETTRLCHRAGNGSAGRHAGPRERRERPGECTPQGSAPEKWPWCRKTPCPRRSRLRRVSCRFWLCGRSRFCWAGWLIDTIEVSMVKCRRRARLCRSGNPQAEIQT